MADFIKLVESWSFPIDLYGGMLFLPTGRQKQHATIQVYGKKLNFRDFYKIGC